LTTAAQDIPRNFTEGHAENWQVTPGLRMHLPAGWQIEALIGYGETDDDARSYYGTNGTALNAPWQQQSCHSV
jgi:iron complex outermembrane receptor protein